jgi:hypothetical protein
MKKPLQLRLSRRRVLAVCDYWSGEATHGCWIRGTFTVQPGRRTDN